MSSTRSSSRRAFPELPIARAFRARLDAWIRRRGPTRPPLALGYRQIYILPTAFGWGVGVLLFAMLLGSLNFNNNLGLFTTFLVAGIALLSMHATHRNLEGLRIEHCQAASPFAGDPLELAVTLHDARGRGRSGLVAELDRRRCSRALALEPWSRGELVLPVPTHERGWIEIPRIRLRTRFPIGWFEAWSWFWPERRFLVWPRPAEHAPPLPAASERQTPARPGDESDEFHGLREWREGDPLHRIAWKASQRHGVLLARQFGRPERGRLVLRLADAPGAGLEQRISVLTRWVLDADAAGLEFGLELGSESLVPARGDSHRTRCLNALAEFGQKR